MYVIQVHTSCHNVQINTHVYWYIHNVSKYENYLYNVEVNYIFPDNVCIL